jgi:hypothetical protein
VSPTATPAHPQGKRGSWPTTLSWPSRRRSSRAGTRGGAAAKAPTHASSTVSTLSTRTRFSAVGGVARCAATRAASDDTARACTNAAAEVSGDQRRECRRGGGASQRRPKDEQTLKTTPCMHETTMDT